MADDIKPGFTLFGRDLSRVTCLRSSLLSGVGGGIASGLAFFMYSSNVLKSSHVGFGSYIIITSVAWMVCRHRKEDQLLFNEETYRKGVQTRILTEGTVLEKKILTESKDA